LLPPERKSKAAPAGPGVNRCAGKADRTFDELAGLQLGENSGYGREPGVPGTREFVGRQLGRTAVPGAPV
jgi:hypothetical protein